MEQREEFVRLAMLGGANVSKLVSASASAGHGPSLVEAIRGRKAALGLRTGRGRPLVSPLRTQAATEAEIFASVPRTTTRGAHARIRGVMERPGLEERTVAEHDHRGPSPSRQARRAPKQVPRAVYPL